MTLTVYYSNKSPCNTWICYHITWCSKQQSVKDMEQKKMAGFFARLSFPSKLWWCPYSLLQIERLNARKTELHCECTGVNVFLALTHWNMDLVQDCSSSSADAPDLQSCAKPLILLQYSRQILNPICNSIRHPWGCRIIGLSFVTSLMD